MEGILSIADALLAQCNTFSLSARDVSSRRSVWMNVSIDKDPAGPGWEINFDSRDLLLLRMPNWSPWPQKEMSSPVQENFTAESFLGLTSRD